MNTEAILLRGWRMRWSALLDYLGQRPVRHPFVMALWLLVLTVPGLALADDALSAKVTAPATVVGDGSPDKPFVFACGSKGKLSVTTDADQVAWIVTSCAGVDPEVLPGGRMLWFATDQPGRYVAFIALAKSVKEGEQSKLVAGGAACWFEIRGPNGPPDPVKQTLRSRTVTAITGPDARADAQKLSGLVSAVADALADGEYSDTGQLFTAWNKALAKGGWPAGRYREVPQIFRDVFAPIPPGSDAVPINDQLRKALLENLRLVESAAEEVSRE